jgi:hypothetical protein
VQLSHKESRSSQTLDRKLKWDNRWPGIEKCTSTVQYLIPNDKCTSTVQYLIPDSLSPITTSQRKL